MRLDKLIRNSGAVIVSGDAHIEVSSICSDSRKVTASSMFIAIKGFAVDGHDYISIAIGKGARVIVYEDQKDYNSNTPAQDVHHHGLQLWSAFDHSKLCRREK